MGSWELLEEGSEVAAIHAALLPNGEVVYYDGNRGQENPALTRIWDPREHLVREIANAPETDLFCNGLAVLADGKLLVAGGTALYHIDDPETGAAIQKWHGSRAAYRFALDTAWERIADMSFGRWYPSVIPLSDGRALVVSGLNGNGDEVVTLEAEIFDPASGTWQVLPATADRTLPLYPRLHLLANGEVAFAGQGEDVAALSLESMTWREIEHSHEPPNPGGGESPRPGAGLGPAHSHGAPGSEGFRPDDLSVLIGPAQDMRVLNAGGGDVQATNRAQIIDFREGAPHWRGIAPMHHARWFPNSALLPDGRLFVVGGGSSRDGDPVMEPEIFDPATESWTLDTPMHVRRMYHSVALLLPNGQVWVAGTDGELQMELYSPDYLEGGPRPVLFAAPESVTYNQVVHIPMADPNDVIDACFIRLGSVTHAFNMTQRYIPLPIVGVEDGELMLLAPTDEFVAPQGYYMLFVRSGAGVPAEAPIVRLVAV